jgi:PAS domain S-box-containing protein
MRKKSKQELLGQIDHLQEQLSEAKGTLHAIRNGEVDAFVVSAPDGEHIYTLKSADYTYRVLVESMNEGALTLAQDGTIFYCNRRFAEMLKTPSEKLIGSSILEYLEPVELDEIKGLLRQTENANLKTELHINAADGTKIPVLITVNSLPIDDMPRFCVVVTDLTDRKQTEETQRLLIAIQEEKERLSALVNSMTDEVWFADTRKRFTLVNASALREFGLSSAGEIDVEELAANLEVYRPDGPPRPAEEAPPLRALAGEVVRSEEEMIRSPATGELRHRQVSSTPVRNAGGDIIGSVSVVRDITDQVATAMERIRLIGELKKSRDELEIRVEERTAELSENERKFRKLSQEFHTLLNAISDTLILLSPEMEVLWTNGGNILELNETVSDAAGQYCHKLLHDRFNTAEDSLITRCFNTAEKEVAVVTHNGAVLDIKAFPIKEAERVSSVLLVVSDITEKMAMQAEAMQAAHMASLGGLAAGVAHEINNPITGIINYGQILINECRPESMEKDIGERIAKEGERIGRIVKTLLSYARDGREEKKPIRVPAILEESMILTQAQIRKEGIELKMDLPDDLPEVDANFQQIQQVFINIINNARYALNEKYSGRHKNKRLEITGERVTISDRPYVRIILCDRGVGISAHELPVITKPFFSTKPFGKGTGLGLNITERIITNHGGRLSFESIKGEFTRVIIDLPAN